MDAHEDAPEQKTGRRTAQPAHGPERRSEPQPEPIRFYGTTWVDHSGGYPLRRAGLAVGALVLAAAGAFLLRFAYDGLAIADVGGWVSILVVAAFAICSSLAFSRTMAGFGRRDDEAGSGAAGADSSLRSVKAIGFIGVLAAYALRSVVEAPGEKLLRAEYEEELARYERRRSGRSGNPSAKRGPKARRKR